MSSSPSQICIMSSNLSPPSLTYHHTYHIYHRSVGSFDTQGVHPSTSNAKGSYGDSAIAAAIKASNDLVNSGQLKAYPVKPGQTKAGDMSVPGQTKAGNVSSVPGQNRAGNLTTPVSTKAGDLSTPGRTRAGDFPMQGQARAGNLTAPGQTGAGSLSTPSQTKAGSLTAVAKDETAWVSSATSAIPEDAAAEAATATTATTAMNATRGTIASTSSLFRGIPG